MADVGAVTFTSSAGKQVTIPVPEPATAVYVTSTGRQVTAAEIEEWTGRIPGRPVRAVLRRQTRRAEGRQSERDVVAARPAPILKGLVRGYGQAPPEPPPKAVVGSRDAFEGAAPRAAPGPAQSGLQRRVDDLMDELDVERRSFETATGRLRARLAAVEAAFRAAAPAAARAHLGQ